jgi:maleate isomerase
MQGWRTRIGLIVPSANTTNEPEFVDFAPDGVTVHASRMLHEETTVENMEAMFDTSQRCAELLETANPDVLAFGCTTGSLVSGEPSYALEMERELADVGGVPAVATAASILRAFEAMEMDSMVVHTPYPDALNERERTFIEDAGFDVRALEGLGLKPTTDKGEIHPETVYRHARAIDRSDADGVFISCTNYRTFEVIEALEADLDKPVVTSNQALLWNALSVAGVDAADVPLGSLFERDVPDIDVAPDRPAASAPEA